jgi:hypothetical protein
MFALRKQVSRRTGLRLGLSLGFTDLDRDHQPRLDRERGRRSLSSYSTQGWEVSDHMARFGVSLFF